MKINKIIFAFSLLLGVCANAQTELPKIKLTPEGTEPIIVEVEGKSAEEIYKSTLNWIQETYKNPDEVLKANIENQKVRFNGFAQYAFSYKTMGMEMDYDMEYTVEIEFKDGKYRFTYTIGQFWGKGNPPGKTGWNYTVFYKKTGEERKAYAGAIPSLEKTMNDLNQSLYNYVSGITEANNGDW